MPNDKLDRAKQFMPFDALKGFREALKEKEKLVEDKILLDEDSSKIINEILTTLKVGDTVKITYYSDYKYIDKIINIKKLSYQSGKIILNNNIIYYDDIKNIEKIN